MIVIDNKFEIGQTVYLKTDKEQLPRIVTAIYVTSGSTLYYLCQGVNETKHYEIEINEAKNVLLATEN